MICRPNFLLEGDKMPDRTLSEYNGVSKDELEQLLKEEFHKTFGRNFHEKHASLINLDDLTKKRRFLGRCFIAISALPRRAFFKLT